MGTAQVPPLRIAPFVAVLAQSSQIGGAERNVLELAAADRATWTIFARDTGQGPLDQLADALGLELHKVSGLRNLLALLRRSPPRMLWTFGYRWSLQLRIGIRAQAVIYPSKQRTYLFVAQRGLDTWRRQWHNTLDRMTQSYVDRYIANSAAAAHLLMQEVGIDPERIAVIRSGVDESWTSSPVVQPSSPGTASLIMVGNAREEKNFAFALDVLKSFSGDLPWHLTIYTNRPIYFSPEELPSELVPRVNVVVGHTMTPSDYDQAHLLLLTSTSESAPRVVMEAAARGLPIVAADVGDVSYLVDQQWTFPPGSRTRALETIQQALSRISRGQLRWHYPSAQRSQSDVQQELRSLVEELDAPRSQQALPHSRARGCWIFGPRRPHPTSQK